MKWANIYHFGLSVFIYCCVFASLLSPSWDIWEKALKDIINHPLLDFTLLLHAPCYLMSCLLPFLPTVSFVSCYLLTSSREELVMIQIDNYLSQIFVFHHVSESESYIFNWNLTLKTATQLCLFSCLLLKTKFPVIVQERRHPLWSQGLDSFFLFLKELCGCVKPCIYSVKFVFTKGYRPFSLFSCHQRPLPWDVSRR